MIPRYSFPSRGRCSLLAVFTCCYFVYHGKQPWKGLPASVPWTQSNYVLKKRGSSKLRKAGHGNKGESISLMLQRLCYHHGEEQRHLPIPVPPNALPGWDQHHPHKGRDSQGSSAETSLLGSAAALRLKYSFHFDVILI